MNETEQQPILYAKTDILINIQNALFLSAGALLGGIINTNLHHSEVIHPNLRALLFCTVIVTRIIKYSSIDRFSPRFATLKERLRYFIVNDNQLREALLHITDCLLTGFAIGQGVSIIQNLIYDLTSSTITPVINPQPTPHPTIIPSRLISV
jgi:hypothetical protein